MEEEFDEDKREEIENIVAENEAVNLPESDNSLDAFEKQDDTSRHATSNAAKLNFYADVNHTDTTKQQTKWAVNLFTGIY